MPRDRSRSPQRETRRRHRSRSTSRDRDKNRDLDRDRNRDRDRARDRDRERDKDHDRKKRRHDRSRSRSRHRRRSPRADSRDRRSKKDHKSRRSRSRSAGNDDVVFMGEQKPQHQKACPSDKDSNLVDLTTNGDNKNDTESNVDGTAKEEVDTDMMMKLMGFGDFNTTKGKHVEDNAIGSKRISVKRKYRQYMNRQGGFNRPLDASH